MLEALTKFLVVYTVVGGIAMLVLVGLVYVLSQFVTLPDIAWMLLGFFLTLPAMLAANWIAFDWVDK